MKATVMTGREPARSLRDLIAGQVAGLAKAPCLVIVRNEGHPEAAAYARQVARGARRVGIPVREDFIDESSTTATTIRLIDGLAVDSQVHGIILALPLPSQVDTQRVVAALPTHKDVDRITSGALGELLTGTSHRAPGVAMAVMQLLAHYEIPLTGRHVVVVGRSPTVGKPVGLLMLAQHATVTICHSRTPDLAATTSQADVVVAGAGRPGLITRDHLGEGAVVVDVGTSYTADGVQGDVEVESIASVASAYSPVPGGVGPLTVYCLLLNVLNLFYDAERAQ